VVAGAGNTPLGFSVFNKVKNIEKPFKFHEEAKQFASSVYQNIW